MGFALRRRVHAPFSQALCGFLKQPSCCLKKEFLEAPSLLLPLPPPPRLFSVFTPARSFSSSTASALRGAQVPRSRLLPPGPPTLPPSGGPQGLHRALLQRERSLAGRCGRCRSLPVARDSPPSRATPRPGGRRLRRAGGGEGSGGSSGGSRLLCSLLAPRNPDLPPPLPPATPSLLPRLVVPPPPPTRPRWLPRRTREGARRVRRPLGSARPGRRACPCCPPRSPAACSISRW